MKPWLKLVIAVALPLMVGGVAGYFTVSGLGAWYQSINKPVWNPPNAVFGPVWTVLYILMGIALYLVWKSHVPLKRKRSAMILWVLQLVLNFFWSFIFFRQHNIEGAFIEIIALWILIVLTIFAFAKCSKTAAWLMVPYICWVSFAALLTYTIWHLNA